MRQYATCGIPKPWRRPKQHNKHDHREHEHEKNGIQDDRGHPSKSVKKGDAPGKPKILAAASITCVRGKIIVPGFEVVPIVEELLRNPAGRRQIWLLTRLKPRHFLHAFGRTICMQAPTWEGSFVFHLKLARCGTRDW